MSILYDEDILSERTDMEIYKNKEKEDRQSRICRIDKGGCRVIRTIHPVGQGAFYSEQFYDASGNLLRTIVYDCGSYPKSFVNTEVCSFFSPRDVIDVLFLSHLDYDHISGLEELKQICDIDTVVLPLLNSVDKMYLLCQGIDKLLITDPQKYFNSSRVLFVLPSVNDENNHEAEQLQNTEVKYESLDNQLLSGTRIIMPFDISWVYIPFNFESLARRQLFFPLLKTIDGLKTIDLDDAGQVDKVIKEADSHLLEVLKKIFKENLKDGSNRVSMLVYSGPLHVGYNIFDQLDTTLLKDTFLNGQLKANAVAALYMGDTDLNDPDLLDRLKSELNGLDKNIGTVQLPHHGSRKNFTKDLFQIGTDKGKRLYFASFGTGNRYGHPSYHVISEVLMSGHVFVAVTEKRDSVIIQQIF